MASTYRYRTPDLYFEKPTVVHRELKRAPIDATAFLGFTTRGPVNEPVRITTWKGFEAVFGGFDPAYLLPQTVFSFLSNGGREAVVVRIAKQDAGDGGARCSETTLRDLYGRPTLVVRAKDPGRWGDRVKVRVGRASRPPKTRLLAPLAAGATEAEVELTRGFEPGAVLRIAHGARNEYVTLTEVAHKRLRWDTKHALQAAYDVEHAEVQGVELQVQVTSPFGFEIHDNLAYAPDHPRCFATVINQRSNTIQVERLATRSPAPYDHPQAEVEVALRGGEEGVSKVTPAEFMGVDRGLGDRTGLFVLEDLEDVGLICLPDLQTAFERGAFKSREDIAAVQRAAVDYCERVKTAVAILDVPKGFDPDQALDWRQRFDSKYGALYYPWYQVQNPLQRGGVMLSPPCGHITGLTSQLDQSEGVHVAAANRMLKDVIGLERDLNKDVIDYLAPEGVNCSRLYPGRGIRPWGVRTLSSDASWVHLNVRRLFIQVQRTVLEGCEWAVFERNAPETWKAIERQISGLLYGMWREGMIVGRIPEEAFYVKCDAELNPPEVREAGELYCDIALAPVRPAEFIVFRIGQQAKDIITEETP